MEIYTDNRSQKYDELNLNNNDGICWLFSRSKCQFGFRGRSRIDSGIDNTKYWEKLSEQSKAMWSWPRPGDPYIIDQKKDISVIQCKQVSTNFTVLKISTTHFDQLNLHKPFHTRRRWILDKEWCEERIIP